MTAKKVPAKTQSTTKDKPAPSTGKGPTTATSIADLTPHLPYTDLREWIAEAEKLGEVREVSGASWQEDIGMATEVLCHDESAPAVLFKDIPGTLPGSRVLVNFFGGQRQKMTLGFPGHLNKLELSDAFRHHYMADLKRIPRSSSTTARSSRT